MEKRISIRMEKNILDRLKDYAEHEKRSLNSQILIIIREGIQKHEKEEGELEV